jgi:hypothetical protein
MLLPHLDRAAVADRAFEGQEVPISVPTQTEQRACGTEPAVMRVQEKIDLSGHGLNDDRPLTTERCPHRFEIGHRDLEL